MSTFNVNDAAKMMGGPPDIQIPTIYSPVYSPAYSPVSAFGFINDDDSDYYKNASLTRDSFVVYYNCLRRFSYPTIQDIFNKLNQGSLNLLTNKFNLQQKELKHLLKLKYKFGNKLNNFLQNTNQQYQYYIMAGGKRK